ncbi:MAG: hypothetical protein HY298_01800 [Verrucomicrobia bacterium]|nr:hypothetical protein [Verrucomicrobiota bacterium]
MSSQLSPKQWMSSRWLVFVLVFAWKAALLVFSAQPVPANDSFFYDGPVVNFLLNGNYVNPALAMAFPISGAEVFSAYPPLYQLVLLPWMFVFGTSAVSAMWLHLVLFGAYMLILLAIFKHLRTPSWCVNIAGGFLLVQTFHDRPDGLAHVFGMLAVYSWIRSRRFFAQKDSAKPSHGWALAAAALVVLCLGSSLQIGGIYFLWIAIGMLASTLAKEEKFPLAPMLVMVLVPIALVIYVASIHPNLWSGFLEHARQTPSLTGWRWPTTAELLKVARTVPGVIAIGVLLPWLWFKQWKDFESPADVAHELVVMTGLLTALAVVAACLVLVTSNMIGVAAYLQPLLVAAYLALRAALLPGKRSMRAQAVFFVLLMLLGSIRAVGMTTWGLICAADVSYASAIQRVQEEMGNLSQEGKPAVVLSAAYLYEAARHDDVNWIHSDWLAKIQPSKTGSDVEGLISLRPSKVILTQFDYYRRYEPVIAQLKSRPELVEIQLVNTARVAPPDSIKSLQKVVQHISWAPVIVTFAWRDKP